MHEDLDAQRLACLEKEELLLALTEPCDLARDDHFTLAGEYRRMFDNLTGTAAARQYL